MAGNIKGITIEIGGDTTPLDKALQGVNQSSRNLQTELRQVNGLLKFDPTNVNLLGQKQDVLKQKVEASRQKLKELQEAQGQVEKQFETGKLGEDQWRAFQRELESTKGKLKEAESQLKETESTIKESSTHVGGLKGAFSNLAEQSQASTSAITTHLGSLKGTLLGFASAALAGLSINSIVDATNKSEKTMAQMDSVLKSTGNAAGMTKQQLVDLASAQANVTTYSAGTTKEAENMLLTFTNIKSNVFPQTIKAAEDMATAMHMDATDAAKTLGKALNDPAEGLSKLSKQGVTFTESQKEQIKAMQKAGDTAGVQKMILGELEKEFGGSAKAAGSTFTGQIQIMNNNLKGAGVTIATALMPIITNLMPSIVKGAQSIAAEIAAHKADIIGAVQLAANLVKTLFTFVLNNGPAIKGVLLAIGAGFAVFQIAGTIMGVVEAVKKFQEAQKAASLAQAVLNAVMSANPIGLIVLAITAVIAVLILLWNNCKPFRDFVLAVIDEIKLQFMAAWGMIKAVWDAVLPFFQGLWTGITIVFSAVGKWFSDVFGAASKNIQDSFNGQVKFFQGIWTGITTIFSVVGSWFTGIFKSAYTGVTDVWNGLTGFFSGLWTGISDGIKGFINDIIRGVNVMIGLLDTIKFSIPSWVPAIGGQSFGINIPQIPLLAKGGVIDSPTFAMLGEAGREAVLPLENNTAWINELADKIANHTGKGKGIEQTLNVYSNKPLTPSEVARQSKNALRRAALELET